VPLRYYDFYAEFPKRLKATEGKQIHLKNIPTGLATYADISLARLSIASREATFYNRFWRSV
jgi:hypothetical protein